MTIFRVEVTLTGWVEVPDRTEHDDELDLTFTVPDFAAAEARARTMLVEPIPAGSFEFDVFAEVVLPEERQAEARAAGLL